MARYFLRFTHADTGLTPTFTFFKKASDLTDVTPPSVVELAGGTYYFDFAPTFDIIFEVDGGAAVSDIHDRYISDTLAPRDLYIDEPTSQVVTDVWTDVVNYSAGTKGDDLENAGGGSSPSAIADAVWDEATAGHVTAGTTGKTLIDTLAAALAVSPSAISDAVWDEATAGHATAGTTGKALTDTLAAAQAVSPSAIADAVWDEATSGHSTAGSTGKALSDTLSTATASAASIATILAVSTGRWKIFTSGGDANRLVLYESDGTTVLMKFDLKDSSGAATTTSPFERDPV